MSLKQNLGEILGKISNMFKSKVVQAVTIVLILALAGVAIAVTADKNNGEENVTTETTITSTTTQKVDETKEAETTTVKETTTTEAETTTVEETTTKIKSETTTEAEVITTTEMVTAATTTEPVTTLKTTNVEKIISAIDLDKIARVSVHDPSIIVGTDKSGNKCYYIFGSHLAWAKSYDLKNWHTFTNNINNNYNSLFADAFQWSSAGDSKYTNSGNMWAPDVIYNTSLKKWCMYMSINGRSWNSSIVMLTADSLEGNWTVAGTVVYSGFNKTGTYTYTNTDYVKATGDSDFSKYGSRFVTAARAWIIENNVPITEASTWNGNYGAHAIDPSVFYDKNGQLWMTYGSWSGGIWMLKLSNSTGLRDYGTTYSYNNNVTDPYMGYHLSGGNFVSGEASYVVYDAKTAYYYLYVTYYSLNKTGGYQMRLFRSKNVTGPYTDADGTLATNTTSQSTAGIKLLGNYYFSCFGNSSGLHKQGYMAPGHNSAFIDSDGSYYLIYHTRFYYWKDNNPEAHEVRVHQQFLNEDNWLVTAVYENRGDKISKTGYTLDEMAGTYEMVVMGTFNDGDSVIPTRELTLNKDGTVSGYYHDGTWTYNNQYVTITVGSVVYKGVFFKQKDESNAHNEVMTFTCISNKSIAIMGSK